MTLAAPYAISEPVIMNFSVSRYMSGKSIVGSHLLRSAEIGPGFAVAGFCVMLYDHLLTFRQEVRPQAHRQAVR